MTIHSAKKDWSFRSCSYPGSRRDIPGIQSITNPEELEEERRLAYVAITRAREKLFCLHVKERLLYGHTQYNQPSRFISEMPDEVVDRETPPDVVEKQTSSRPPHASEKKCHLKANFSAKQRLPAA